MSPVLKIYCVHWVDVDEVCILCLCFSEASFSSINIHQINRRQFCFWCKCVRSYSKYIQLCPLFFASFGRILILSLFNKIYREIKSGCLTYECSKNHASIGKVWTKLWALIVLNNLIIELVKRKHFAAEQNQLCSSKSNTYELILCGR